MLTVKDLLIEHFVKWQYESGVSKKQSEFAIYIGENEKYLSMVMNGRKASKRQIESFEAQQRQNVRSIRSWEEWQKLLTTQPLLQEHFPEWVHSEKPELVNRLLSAIIKEIIINHDQSIEIRWRE